MKKVRKHLNSPRKVQDSYFPTPNELLEQASKQLDNAPTPKKKRGDPLDMKKTKIHSQAKLLGDFLQRKITGLSKQFPNIDEMNPFYLDLLRIILDIDRLKKNLANLHASGTIIKKIRFQYGRRIYGATSIGEALSLLREMQGRLSSVVKKLDRPLKELKEDSKKLKELPAINFDKPAIALAGYPNVGKTTILKRLTGSKAKISPYPFTTKQINMGPVEINYHEVQIIDTPGLLDREIKNKIEEKALAGIKHIAKIVVFIVDPTLSSGYTLEEQLGLLEHVRNEFKDKKIVIVLNKIDIAKEEEIEKAKEALGEVILEGEENSVLLSELSRIMKEQG